MVKARLCFALLYADGTFCLSRNFNLQAVGDYDWLVKNYDFEAIAHSIDDLLILNVGRDEIDWSKFVETIKAVVGHSFMPVAVGGGIRTVAHARRLFENGADKVVLNSAFIHNPLLVNELTELYGSQSIVASLDFRRNEMGEAELFVGGGGINTGLPLGDAIRNAARLGAGEIYLTSIDRDGTGMGYDLGSLEIAFNSCDLPIIAAGGADTADRLAEGIRSGFVSAVSTAHLFNFMGDGLYNAREELIKADIPLSHWNFKEL